MKKNFKKILYLTIILILIFFSSTFAVDLTGREIINKAEDNMDYGNFHSLAQMTIITTGGAKRVLEMDVWGQGTSKSIMKYNQPSRIKGVSFLFLKNDIWSYFPRTGRVRHLASSIKNQKMMGSSFSYDDFSCDAFDDYTVKLIREERLGGEDCYVIEGIAKSDEAAYNRLTAWVTKDGFRLLKVNYFEDKQKVKIMIVNSFFKLNGELRPEKITMEDLNDDNKTVFEYLKIETEVKFSSDFFNKRNLERISRR